MTDIRTTQTPVEVLSSPMPTARVSQTAPELLSSPLPSARLSQHAVEVLAAATLALHGRVSHLAVEVIWALPASRFNALLVAP